MRNPAVLSRPGAVPIIPAVMAEAETSRGPSVRGVPEGDNRERMICA
jgi:hypothetical protein